MWKSREGKSPSPNFWADFVAIVAQLYPEATLDEAALKELYDLVQEQWRNGVQIHLIARQLCTCDGRTIVPSAAAKVHLARMRGIARPPEGAVAGTPFGLERLRAPTGVAQIQRRLIQVSERIERGTKGMEVLARRAGRLTGTKRDELLQTLTDAKLALDALAAERLQLAAMLESATHGKPWESSTREVLERTKTRQPTAPASKTSDSPTPDARVLRKLLLDGRAVLLNKKAFDLPTIRDVDAEDLGFGFFGGTTASGTKFSYQTAEGMKPIGGGISYTTISGDISGVPFKDGSVGYDLERALASVTAALDSAQLAPKRKPTKAAKETAPAPAEKKEKRPRQARTPKTPQAGQVTPPTVSPSTPAESVAPLPDDLVADLINDLAGKS